MVSASFMLWPAKHRNKRGTTLLEIVITMAIMTIGMLGFFTLHFRALQTSKSSVSMSQAVSIASAIQDSLQALPYSPETANLKQWGQCSDMGTDALSDFCHSLPAVDKIGRSVGAGDNFSLYPSYYVGKTADAQLLIMVRVRYPAEDGRCPSCGFRQGWKAVDLTSMRSMTAY